LTTILLNELLQGLLVFATLALPVEALAPDSRWLLYGLFLAAFLLLALLRYASRRVWQLLLPSAVLLVLPFVLPFPPSAYGAIVPDLVCFVGLLLLVIRAVLQRWRSRQDGPALLPLATQSLALLLLLALDFAASRLGIAGFSTGYFAVGVAYLLLVLVRWHRTSLAEQMGRFAATPTQPTARVFRFNRLLLGGALAGTAALLLLSPLLPVYDALGWLWRRLGDLLRWLLSLLRTGPEPTPTPVPEPTSPPTPTPFGEAGPPVVTPEWLRVLQEIFLYLLLAAVVLLAAVGLAYGLYRLYRRFYDAKLPDADRRESLLPSFVDLVQERLRRTGRAIRRPFGRTPEQRIRHAFFRLVASQERHGLELSPSLTAREIVGALDAASHPDLVEVLELYEKARYGAAPCTGTEAERCQRLARGLARRDLVKRADGGADAANPG
jgi:hypothetical protein